MMMLDVDHDLNAVTAMKMMDVDDDGLDHGYDGMDHDLDAISAHEMVDADENGLDQMISIAPKKCEKQVKIIDFLCFIPDFKGNGPQNGIGDGKTTGLNKKKADRMGISSDGLIQGNLKTSLKKSLKKFKTRGAKSKTWKNKLLGTRNKGSDSSQRGIEEYFGKSNLVKKLGNPHGSSSSP